MDHELTCDCNDCHDSRFFAFLDSLTTDQQEQFLRDCYGNTDEVR